MDVKEPHTETKEETPTLNQDKETRITKQITPQITPQQIKERRHQGTPGNFRKRTMKKLCTFGIIRYYGTNPI